MRMPIARFPQHSESRRTDAPTEHITRITWMLVSLLCFETLEYAAYKDRFGRSERQFQRDAYKLRDIGATAGFTISPKISGRIILQTRSPKLEWLARRTSDIAATLRRIAVSLGEPVEQEVRQGIGDGPVDARHGFLHLRMVQPRKGTQGGEIFAYMKTAALACAGVEFFYTTSQQRKSKRCVEPYHVVGRNGRYYLVGFDLERRDWRQFGLDAISGPMRKTGTFTPRSVPERFLRESAVGWFQGGAPMDVAIRLSSLVAVSVASRQWQDTQRIVSLPDGSIEITLRFEDAGEAVRWALSFGAEAVVISPPEVVEAAGELIARLAQAYAIPRLAIVPQQKEVRRKMPRHTSGAP